MIRLSWVYVVVTCAFLGCQETSSRFVILDSVESFSPDDGYEAVVLFLQSYTADAMGEWDLLTSMGFTEGLSERVKFVIPVIKKTSVNSAPGWFPFIKYPWVDEAGTSNLADEEILNQSAQLLMELVDSESVALDGRYDKIFVLGLSQGGMMATWFGLNAQVTLGGIFNYQGCFPISNFSRLLPQQGSEVPVFHIHDPEDSVVPLKYAESGRLAALSAGASNYPPVIRISNPRHHGLIAESARKMRDRLIDMLSGIRLPINPEISKPVE